MSGMKSMHHFHVAWSKNQKDKFVAISSDVKLFEFTSNQPSVVINAAGVGANGSATATTTATTTTLPPTSALVASTAIGNINATNSVGKLRIQNVVPNQPTGPSNLVGRSTKLKQPDQFMNSRLIATGPEVSQFRAAACYPGSISDDDTLVAISCGGLQNTGKIVLVCLRPAGMYSIDNYIHVDLVAKRAVCNDVDWSSVNNSLLATGWDRHKLDNSLQIFDINRVIDTGKYSFNFSVTPNNRPVFDGCSGDSINSLKWFRREQTVLCGLNGKQIRIYDIRDLTKPKQTTPTKAVHGLTVDSFSDRRYASYFENTVHIWDSRMFDKPLVTITESKPISQISWCPTRNHAFSALMSGDDFVKIYDIQQAAIFSEDFEAKIVERLIHPFALSSSPASGSPTTSSFDQALAGPLGGTQNLNMPKQITSFDWHPTSELRLIAISNHRDVIAVNICDRITLNWSPLCEIVWTKGKRILQCLNPRDEKYKSLDDISVNMRHRAITNYGMIVEDGPHHQRGDDSDLIGLLRWVKLAKALDITSKKRQQQQAQQQLANSRTQPGEQNKNCAEILGVGCLLRDSPQQVQSRAEVKAINWKGASATSCIIAPIRFQVYHSELRSRALLLCDWIPDIDNISQTIPIIDYLEKEGNYMRAAAIAVFNMRLQRAVESLTVGAKKSDPNLSSVAMALSGYTGERTSMWREMCQSLKYQLTNPYMKAMFAFLTSESDTGFQEIIYDKNLILADRVAFSLLYLPDDQLYNYLTETMSTLVENGDLNGILLTGITNDGLSLLQRYIEISSDIQSVSLIVLHSLPSAICNDPRAQLWVECYRGMLDCWRLWHQRAHFDNLWYTNSLSQVKPPNHISISCNYCGNSINKSQLQQAQASSVQGHQQPQQEGNSCKKCSFAKCCLCLTQLGSSNQILFDQHKSVQQLNSKLRRPTDSSALASPRSTSNGPKTNPFSNWFSWCQTCRHSAHSAHFLSWFSENSECPVSGCDCKCMSLDSRTKLDDVQRI